MSPDREDRDTPEYADQIDVGSRALALARSALSQAALAKSSALSAGAAAERARIALQTLDQTLGRMVGELGRLADQIGDLVERIDALPARLASPPPLGAPPVAQLRERAPSAHDIAVEVATAVAEKTASHLLPSERVRAIVGQERNATIAKAAIWTLAALAVATIGLVIGHVAWK